MVFCLFCCVSPSLLTLILQLSWNTVTCSTYPGINSRRILYGDDAPHPQGKEQCEVLRDPQRRFWGLQGLAYNLMHFNLITHEVSCRRTCSLGIFVNS